MPHAFLITAYKDIDQLLALIRCLGPEAHVFVHLDLKARIPQEDLERLRQLPTLKTLSRRYAVNWGSTHHLYSILELARTAVKEEQVTYLHLISGSDHPLISWRDFNAFFERHQGNEFIEHFPLPTRYWRDGGLDRLIHFHPLDTLDVHRGRQRRILDFLIMAQKKLGIRRSP